MFNLFAEMITYPFIMRALIVGTLVSLCAALDTCRYHQEDKVGKHIDRTDRQQVGTDDDDRRHTEFEYRIGRINQDTSDKFAFGKTLFVTTETMV